MVYVLVTWSLPILPIPISPIKPKFLMSHWNFCSSRLLHTLQFSRQTSSTFLKRVKALCFSHMVTSNLMHQIQFTVTRLDSIFFKEPNWHWNNKNSKFWLIIQKTAFSVEYCGSHLNETGLPWAARKLESRSQNDTIVIYHSTWEALTLTVWFSEMLKLFY